MAHEKDDPLLLAFSRVLRRYRLAKKLSQQDLATHASRSMQYISLLESGHHQPTLGTLHLLSGALGLTVTELVAEVEKEAGIN
ncbi:MULTISPECIES: helix-turn-helix domain-containing protein [unclassified Ruegeria]|uniref:helix-turn-helix domain-containing protein n=1 Tax=unclassified Ruegeria TaxID=2625375 RepID=UPI0014879819|nr:MULTISPECIES: helix-turn-helix transcriptional regulator [unclassified Ruegeria]NOC93351.1 helix-turn-helix domain-containing protein [Ruegeria sp. HKCCD6604]